MAEIETLGILEEIESLVSDRLQVVSYKWLSRNFLVSSNVAKKLLEEFVAKHNEGFEVVYALAGWLKESPSTYHIRLIPQNKLAEAKEDFRDSCSVQVYSIQSCIPKDPAELWNAEFVQAEELFKNAAADNCLRDNRFCGISNSFVKHSSSGTPNAVPRVKGVSFAASTAKQANSLPQTELKKPQQSSSKGGFPSSGPTAAVKSESDNAVTRSTGSRPSSDTEKARPPASKSKGQADKSGAGAGGIANFWGRASAKSKSPAAPVESNAVDKKKNESADAQISASEALEAGSSDDERLDINVRRNSNGEAGKKRKFVLEESDEEDDLKDAVNLASPDPPKAKSVVDPIQKSGSLNMEGNKLKLDDEEEDPVINPDKSVGMKSDHTLKNDASGINKDGIAGTEDKGANKKNQTDTVASTSPKRRKVLKTRIDERGREVTEVVWEGEDVGKEQKNENAALNSKNKATKTEDAAAANPVNRPAAVKKSPAIASTAAPPAASKAGNKKGANKKDPKQGNILSFFKKA